LTIGKKTKFLNPSKATNFLSTNFSPANLPAANFFQTLFAGQPQQYQDPGGKKTAPAAAGAVG